jgi:hypothetical protein
MQWNGLLIMPARGMSPMVPMMVYSVVNTCKKPEQEVQEATSGKNDAAQQFIIHGRSDANENVNLTRCSASKMRVESKRGIAGGPTENRPHDSSEESGAYRNPPWDATYQVRKPRDIYVSSFSVC